MCSSWNYSGGAFNESFTSRNTVSRNSKMPRRPFQTGKWVLEGPRECGWQRVESCGLTHTILKIKNYKLNCNCCVIKRKYSMIIADNYISRRVQLNRWDIVLKQMYTCKSLWRLFGGLTPLSRQVSLQLREPWFVDCCWSVLFTIKRND